MMILQGVWGWAGEQNYFIGFCQL